jgi:hypothetical protein
MGSQSNIEDFKDIHKNEICFIYGAGPSLHFVDENKLIDYVGISVNGGILKAKKCKKLYYVSDDAGCTNWSYFNLVRDLKNCKVLLYWEKFKDIYSSLKIEEDRCYRFSHKSWFSPEGRKYNYDGLKLKKDGPIIGARTSMASAVNISYIMGCNPIVLLGNDCQLSQDGKKYRYFWQYLPREEQPYRVKGTKFNHITQNFGFSQSDFVEYWTCFEQMNRDILGKEVEIIDASDSVLDCFPKMRIEEVLKKYGEKNK